MKRHYLIFFLFCCWAKSALIAQGRLDTLKITYQADNQPLIGVLNALEPLLNVQIYARPEQLANQYVTIRAQQQPATAVLKEVLLRTRLAPVYYRDYAIILLPDNLVSTKFTPEYYQTRSIAQETPNVPTNDNEVWNIGSTDNIAPTGRATIRINITDAATREPLTGAVVKWPNLPNTGLKTDATGSGELEVPTGVQPISVEMLGYLSKEGILRVWNNGVLNISLVNQPNTLREIQINADAADANVSKTQIGTTRLDPKAIKKAPTLLGEADVVRTLLQTTGVTTVGEGAAGFNVRGGDTDQNLVLQDDIVLYNSSHALGFFSTYNTDLVSKVELYKSIIPAEYGGRLSSVLDVRMSEGNPDRWKVKGGVGMVSGRIGIEGPIVKQRTTLSAGMRGSYSDWVLGIFPQLELKNSSAAFNDINASITHRWNNKNTLTLGAYSAADRFNYNREFGFDYRTQAVQGIYKHSFNERTFSRFSVATSRYDSQQDNLTGNLAGRIVNSVRYLKLKEVFSKRLSEGLKLDLGAEATRYWIEPGTQSPLSPTSVITPKKLATEHGLEIGAFASADWLISSKLAILGGLRWNHYRFLGPKAVFTYDENFKNITDTTLFGAGATIAQYNFIEPRFSFKWQLSKSRSIKTGYSRTSQFINQIFNSDTPTPTSQYQLSTGNIPPFRSHNLALGYFHNTKGNQWELSSEVFYRIIDQLWDYRDFAQLLANETLEREIRQGVGRAYGLELSVRTNRPIYNGQIGYTYSRAFRQVAGINDGNWYASNFDKPHILNFTFNYQPTQRQTLTINFTYSTGRPTTAPISSYRYQDNIIVPIYGYRNQVRIPDYHRMDISYTLGQGYNKKRTLKTSWNLSIYNLYARRNAFSVFFKQAPDLGAVANRLAILGTAFPAITLNIETQ
jgi:TonB-dependent Receptor Plug Domain